MFGSMVIEVGLGLVIAFLLFSLILTALQEGIEAVFKGRAKFLEAAIGELLDANPDTRAQNVATFYRHPLIFPLFSGDYKPASGIGPTKLPSYLPSPSFAKAVEDLARSGQMNSAQVTRIMNLANDLSGGGAGSAQKHLEAWFDSAMERLSGQYKRNTNGWLFGVALLAAAVGNVNAIQIADSLATSQKLRTDVAAFATELSNNSSLPADAKVTIENELKKTGLPVGWESTPHLCNPLDFASNCGKSTFTLLAGWVITALAGMLGAPFWFDLLQKLVRLRSALKPQDVSTALPSSLPASQPVDATQPATSDHQATQNEPELLPEWKDGFKNDEEIRL